MDGVKLQGRQCYQKVSLEFHFSNSLKPSLVYPWESLPADTTICDVGGGTGHATVVLLKACPQLKYVVQDLPGVIEQGKEASTADSLAKLY